MTEKNSTLVIIGATGDLAQKKLFPALAELFSKNSLPKKLSIIAFSRRSWTDAKFRAFTKPHLGRVSSREAKEFLARITYHEGDFKDTSSFEKLMTKVSGIKVYFYLAILPDSYAEVINQIGKTLPKATHIKEKAILIEKPFGKSLASFRLLEKLLSHYFKQSEILPVDHYLGKEALMTFSRLSKDRPTYFNKYWNRNNIKSVKVILKEKRDVGDRAELYESIGAFLDTGQNHCLQMLASVMAATASRGLVNKCEHVIKHLYIDPKRAAIRAQYRGYAKEVGKKTNVETYFQIPLKSTDPAWKDVPLSIEGGKAASENCSEIVLEHIDTDDVIRLQPHSYIALSKNKRSIESKLDAYGYIFLAAFLHKGVLFPTLAEIEASWKIADAGADRLKRTPLQLYKKGTSPKS